MTGYSGECKSALIRPINKRKRKGGLKILKGYNYYQFWRKCIQKL
jgi:hypothetical protein